MDIGMVPLSFEAGPPLAATMSIAPELIPYAWTNLLSIIFLLLYLASAPKT